MITQKQIRSLAIILSLAWTALWAANQIVDFHARRDNQTIILEWATEQESGLKKFHIHRRIDQSNWTVIATVAAQGHSTTRNQYTFRDATIYKSQLASCYYRLETELDDGSKSLHQTIASAAGMSGIRHTWGSLKAMFR